MNSIIWKLLRQHVSPTQLVGFAIANLVGLTIVILAVQFYRDVKPVFDDEESFISKDYLVITRNVTSAGAMMGGTTEFTDADIADLESQPWCRRVGRFANSEFATYATVGLGSSRAMRTEFFFESIPTAFIDVDPAQWDFDPAHPSVPVIVARDYLSLYNFGFASTQGLPRVSENQIGAIPLSFTFMGNGLHEAMPGRIVGFSNRLNTVIVPDTFLTWANQRYGHGGTANPVRLIVEVNRPGDVKIENYMKEHRYDVAGDKMTSSKANYFLTIIIGIVITVGIIISALSFLVLMLSIYLLLQKNTRRLRDLLLLGYSPSQVSSPYKRMVLLINAAVFVLALVGLCLARRWYLPMLAAMGVKGSSITIAALVGLAIMGCITLGNLWAIDRKVRSLWIQD